MRTTFWLLPLLLSACLHTQTVASAQASEKKANEETANEKSASEKSANEKSASEKSAIAEKKPRSTTAKQVAPPGSPPLAATPDGLMVEGGPAQVQRALTERGYLPEHQTGTFDETTMKAMMKFQTDQNLAHTGEPDRETLRRLGLKPEKLFRASKM